MTKKKKIALMTLPVLALVVMGSSVASAYGGTSYNGLTVDQTSALEEARELRKNGEEDEARKVLKKAGIFRAMHRGNHRGMRETLKEPAIPNNVQVMRSALEAHDYSAFKNAVVEMPFASLVTEDSFAKLVEAHELRKAGDKAGAEKILREIGFPEKSLHRGHGMHNPAS